MSKFSSDEDNVDDDDDEENEGDEEEDCAAVEYTTNTLFMVIDELDLAKSLQDLTNIRKLPF
jgi:hypothetical protein